MVRVKKATQVSPDEVLALCREAVDRPFRTTFGVLFGPAETWPMPRGCGYFIADNLNRRQLSSLGKARCLCSLVETEAGCNLDDLYWEDRDKVKASVAKRLGMSLRNLNRYLLVLKTPPAVQEAFERADLLLTEAGKVALLRHDAEAVGDTITAVYSEPMADGSSGDLIRRKVRAVVEEAKGTAPADVKAALFRLVRALKRDLARVKAGLGDIEPAMLANLKVLATDTHGVFTAMMKRAG